MPKMRYKFLGRWDGQLHWESTTRLPGDSRVERITCTAKYFYRSMLPPGVPVPSSGRHRAGR